MRFAKRLSVWALALALGWVLSSAANAAWGLGSKSSATANMIGHPAPDFSLKDAQGNSHSLADFKGKTVVLLWTNPNCRFVQRLDREGSITNLTQKFDQGKVQFIEIVGRQAAPSGMAAGSSPAGGILTLYDPDGAITKQYEAKRTPQAYVINNDGNLIYDGAFDNDPRGRMTASERRNYVDEAVTAAINGQMPKVQDTKPYGCRIKGEKSSLWPLHRKTEGASQTSAPASNQPMTTSPAPSTAPMQ